MGDFIKINVINIMTIKIMIHLNLLKIINNLYDNTNGNHLSQKDC